MFYFSVCGKHVVHLSETSYFGCGTSVISHLLMSKGCWGFYLLGGGGGLLNVHAVLIKLFISGSSNDVLCNLFSLQEYTLDTIL